MIHRHTISFRHAYDGVIWAFKTQPNYRIHAALSLISVIAGNLLKISQMEFIIIILLITIGLTIEAINTGIEATTDAIDKNIREDIKIAKDVAAGAMLIFAIGATIIAYIIFVPKILVLLG